MAVNGGVLKLNKSVGVAISGGTLNVNSGATLLLGTNEQFAAGVSIAFNGGIFNLAGFTQTAALGALTHSADSTLDFGVGGAQVLRFSSLGTYTAGRILSINNWAGLPSGGGTDRIIFDSPGSVTGAFLSDVWFSGYIRGAQILPSGEVVPPLMPFLSITDVTVTEGDSGTTNTAFTVSLSAVSGQNVTVNFTTADGTAVAGGDYVSTNGLLSFAPGTTNQTITVRVNGDLLNEANETFFVNLSNPTNATFGDSQGVGTINNDDPVVAIAISDATVTEGNSGTTNAVFTVSLSAISGQTVTLNFATADGMALAGTDYVSTNGLLSFAPGTTNQTVTVRVNGDLLNEADETFFVFLTTSTNATLSDSLGVGTINNDDPVVSIAINDVAVTEGNSGTTNAVFTVSL
ncbi:MAG TPA: Calx-beta domain-containing protein, partial [Candidatus Dormibacteraeota bacterium]|nr:Calx-beta domain-containing protein [Candidatus Dormibacteraeota bacterium]